jgi:quercetin dioxygenase-like cupin family protein
MSERSRYVIRPHEQQSYQPANHTGTTNYRLIGPKTNGSKYLEISLGEIERNEGAIPHAHPDMEQAVYVIEGEAIAGIDGVDEHIRTGDLLYYPPGVFHSIRVISEQIRLLVIYAPPFEGDPEKIVFE